MPDGHSRPPVRSLHIGRSEIRLPALRVDDLLYEEAMAASNENAANLVTGFFILGLLIVTFILVGILGFVIGRSF